MNVVLIIYNRPELTIQVARKILDAGPQRLFVIADGPKNAADRDRCMSARASVETLDWKCEVIKDYAEMNLGCRRRVASGLDGVFARVEDAIILEDDCVPDSSFFRFCQEMLNYFRDDARVGHISGDSFHGNENRSPYSYYFSQYSVNWGWATWRRAWKEFDAGIKLWPELAAGNWHYDVFQTKKEAEFYEAVWDSVCDGNTHIWDAQWLFSRLIHASLSVIPAVNLVTNIGWGAHGTYTRDIGNPAAGMSTQAMKFPLKHPPFMICDMHAQKYLVDKVLVGRTKVVKECVRRLKNKHYYGKILRQVPVLGKVWADVRAHRTPNKTPDEKRPS